MTIFRTVFFQDSAPVPEPETGGLYLLRKESSSDRLPSVLTPVLQQPNTASLTDPILALDPRGLSDFGLRLTLGESISTPNTLFSSPAAYACLAMGFPQLEFSANEVIAWPRPPVAPAAQRPRQPDVRGPSARYGGIYIMDQIFIKTPIFTAV